MRLLARQVASTVTVCVLAGALSSIAFAQRGHPPVHPAVHPNHVIFVGGYFYDPFFGPYPWWGPAGYPYPYYPDFDARAVLRVIATPKSAGVYVDGFYAGIVDDFDGFFQGLPVTPGGHEIVLYQPDYRTERRRVYAAPGTTLAIHAALAPLAPGETSDLPNFAPPLPMPPAGTFVPPHTAATTIAPTPTETAILTQGTIDLQVEPADAEVRIDGEPWVTSDRGRFVIQLRAGAHRLDVSSAGYHGYDTDIVIPDNGTIQLKVTLTRGITR